MLIKYNRYCYDEVLTVDGINFDNHKDEEKIEIISKIIKKIKKSDLAEALKVVLSYCEADVCELEQCEQCFDTNEFLEVFV